MRSHEKTALEAVFFRLGITPRPETFEKTSRFLELLLVKNKSVNLTRIDTFEAACVLHVEDALSVLPEFQLKEGVFCDIGTGGGVPGIPLALLTSKSGVLLDSVKKKVNAVQEFVDCLGIDEQISCVGERSEIYALTQPEAFDVVISRAVSSLPVVMELSTPLLKKSGLCIAMRGTENEEAVNDAVSVSPKLGLELENVRKFTIGPSDLQYNRSVYVFERVSEPQLKLPRRPGMAAKRPLR